MDAAMIRSFRDLDTWNVAMDLAVDCYKAAKQLPANERFEMSPQLRSAATSVPSNVAEGHATGSDGSCMRHLRIALGSVGGLDTQLELALRIGLLPAPEVKRLQEHAARTAQLLHGLLRSVRKRRLQNAAKDVSAFCCASALAGSCDSSLTRSGAPAARCLRLDARVRQPCTDQD
jgi:four helix bundle protein